MKYSKLKYYLLATITFLICLTGCSEENSLLPDSQPSEKEMIEAKLMLSLNMKGVSTRAGGTSLSGTEVENKLNKITLFIVGGETVQTFTVPMAEQDKQFVFVNVETTQGSKAIFIGANMTDDQIEAVKNATDANPMQTITNISEITKNNDFLMTGQAVTESGDKEINIEAGKITNIKVELNRIVAKVLLTCSTPTDKEEYAMLAGDNGYMKLSDIHYILTTTNRKFYPFAKNNNEDPNYKMNETLKNLKDDFFTSTEEVKSGKQAVKYDASKLQESENRYTDGIYCLENTVDLEGKTYPTDLTDPKKVMTYLKIAAKFTPKYIDGIEAALSEEEASKKLTNGTFYTCKKAPAAANKRCYSSIQEGIAYLKALNVETNEKDFIEYQGGWQYYETFVNSPANFSEASGLKRNNYYIVNVTKFNAPVQEKTIEVNTTIAQWTTKGTTTIDIETGGNKE